MKRRPEAVIQKMRADIEVWHMRRVQFSPANTKKRWTHMVEQVANSVLLRTEVFFDWEITPDDRKNFYSILHSANPTMHARWRIEPSQHRPRHVMIVTYTGSF